MIQPNELCTDFTPIAQHERASLDSVPILLRSQADALLRRRRIASTVASALESNTRLRFCPDEQEETTKVADKFGRFYRLELCLALYITKTLQLVQMAVESTRRVSVTAQQKSGDKTAAAGVRKRGARRVWRV